MSLDEFGKSNNVITLCSSDRSKLLADLTLTTEPVRKAVIHSLNIKPKGRSIHWDKDTGRYSCAKDFFRILHEQGKVSVLCDSNSITKYSILNVLDKNGSEYELPVSYFMRLTNDGPDGMEDVDAYIMRYFNDLDIHVGMRTNDSSICEIELNREELTLYRPEEIYACTSEGEAFYTCQLIHKKTEPIGYGEPDQFDCVGNKVTLLDLMISSLSDAEINNFSIDGASMEVSLFERNDSVITSIEPELLHEVIFEAIKRTNLLYANMSYEKAVKRYMNTVVIPKLKPIDEAEYED